MRINKIDIIGNSITIYANCGTYLGEIIQDTIGYYLKSYPSNSFLFERLHISDRLEYVSKIVGYRVNCGTFPFVKTRDDVLKVLYALQKESNKNSLLHEINNTFNIITIKSKRNTNFNFKL